MRCGSSIFVRLDAKVAWCSSLLPTTASQQPRAMLLEVRTSLPPSQTSSPLRILGGTRASLPGTTVTRDRTAGTLKSPQETYTRQLLPGSFRMSANPAVSTTSALIVKEGAPSPPGKLLPRTRWVPSYLACGTRPDIAHAAHSLFHAGAHSSLPAGRHLPYCGTWSAPSMWVSPMRQQPRARC
jgi:hypothetical protein